MTTDVLAIGVGDDSPPSRVLSRESMTRAMAPTSAIAATTMAAISHVGVSLPGLPGPAGGVPVPGGGGSVGATAAPQPWQKRASSSLARPQLGQLLAMSPPDMVSRVVERHRIRSMARGTGVLPW